MKYCEDPLWNSTLSWHTSNPRITQCLQATLISVPCCTFLLILPLWIHNIYKRRQVTSSNLQVLSQRSYFGHYLIGTRILFYIFNLSTTLVLLFMNSSSQTVMYIMEHVSLSVACLASIIMELILVHNKRHTCKPLPLIWFIISFVTIPQLKESIEGLLLGELSDVITWMKLFRWVSLLITACLQAIANKSVIPENSNPENAASSVSDMLFSWFFNLIWKGWKRPLVESDIPPTSYEMEVAHNAKIFLDASSTYRSRYGRIELWWVLIKCFYAPYLSGVVCFVVRIGFIFLNPFLMKLLIQYVESDSEPTWHGYFYALSLFLCNMVAIVLDHNGLRYVCVAGNKIKTATTSAIYRKTLRLSSKARQRFTTGEITNLMSVDAVRFVETVPFSYFVVTAPMEVVICLTLVYQNLGVSVLAGVAVLFLIMPLSLMASKKGESYQDAQLLYKDQRIKLMSEILSGIKVLKLYAWEKPFTEAINKIRSQEISIIRYIAKLWSIVSFSFSSIPIIMMLSTILVHVYTDSKIPLTADVIFSTLALFNLIRTPLTLFPLALMEILKLFVSVKRINDFLNAEELDDCEAERQSRGTMSDPRLAIEVEDGTFYWENPDSPTLKEVNFKVRQGELVAVVGMVGSGKSSLISAVLGELARSSGKASKVGKVAYVPQQPWIQNLTVKKNILFGKPFNEATYVKALSACCLDRDLQELPAGDETEIGENGINISGGQKMRISLARATYQDADLYILDDPLAALDAHVGRDVFQGIIGREGVLATKTRVLVTHNISVLKHVDRIFVMRDGRTAESGTFTELLNKKGPFADFLQEHFKDHTEAEEAMDGEDEETLSEISSVIGSLPIARSRNENFQPASLPKSFFKGPAKPRPRVNRSVSECHHDPEDQRGVDVLKRRFSKDLRQSEVSKLSPKSDSISKGGSAVGVNGSSHLEAKKGGHKDNQIVDNAASPEARLTENEEALTGDVNMSIYIKYIRALGLTVFFINMMVYFVCEGLNIGSSYALSSWTDDPDRDESGVRDKYMAIYGSLGGVYSIVFLGKELMLFLACAQAAKKIHETLLERTMHSPMSFFDTNPMGRILNRFSSDVDTVDNVLAFQIDDVANCLAEVVGILVIISYATPWFLLAMVPISLVYYAVQKFYITTSRQIRRLDMISRSPIFSHFSETITGAASIRAFDAATERFIEESEELVQRNNLCNWSWLISNRWLGIRLENLGNLIILGASLLAVVAKENLTSGLAGLSISYSLMSIESLNWMVRMICALETNAISLERIFEYCERESEPEWHQTKDEQLIQGGWPDRGDLSFHQVSASYRDGLPNVIKNFNVAIKHGEKIGICGRTGAGKSSLSLLLFRIMEASEGEIRVDNENLATVGLQLLRSRLTIIPQDPVLFSSSLRFNLDPASQYSDEQVSQCLTRAGLGDYASDLNQEVQEKGENFSVGQRQLICLARALLRSSKLLMLDEATAAVDLETDEVVQRTIREQFKDCTVLTIAHRLNTIMDSDRVLVLNHGEVVEFDEPKSLLLNPESTFYSLAKESGLV